MKSALGSLCKREHSHQETGQSLRYVQTNGKLGTCIKCKKLIDSRKPKEDPAINRTRSAKWRAENPDKNKSGCANWRKQNLESARAESRNWHRANPEKTRHNQSKRRAKKLEAPTISFTSDELITRFRKAFNCQCAYCKSPLVYSEVNWDHVIPLCKGGEQSLRNFVPTCKTCNSSKRHKPVLEWLSDSDRSLPYWLFNLLTEEWFILAYAKSL